MLAGQIAVVTGAAGGLGAAFVAALRDAGATVVGSDIRTGADAVVDAGDAEAVRAWIDTVVATHGRIDLAVANAGISRAGRPTGDFDTAVRDFDEQWRVNARGPFVLGRAVIPAMVAQGSGHIVVISTDHVAPPPGRPTGGGSTMDGYDASKWALRGLVEAWHRAVNRNGVRVNALCPGATDTAMLRGFLGDQVTEEMVAGWMRPEAVAGLLVELVAEGPGGRSGEHLGVWAGHPLALPAPMPTAELDRASLLGRR
jgi:NAD(P)-dependent dehydrogenase (short-subunit alcohol dehydrogenase family)